MGIGLSLCQQIIKKHGGNFYLQESQKGKTVFVIEWPETPLVQISTISLNTTSSDNNIHFCMGRHYIPAHTKNLFFYPQLI